MVATTTPETADFAWLHDAGRRRSALAEVHRAIRDGWLDGPEMARRRAALIAALDGLEAEELRPREYRLVCRIHRALFPRC